jgi:hypothetical protein
MPEWHAEYQNASYKAFITYQVTAPILTYKPFLEILLVFSKPFWHAEYCSASHSGMLNAA